MSTIGLVELTAMIETGGLSAVQHHTAEHAPNSLVTFSTLDPMPMMQLVGDRQQDASAFSTALGDYACGGR